MNITERKAYKWLIKKGYGEKDIKFHQRGTPDFTTCDGAGYEVKLLYSKTIWFYKFQLDSLVKIPNTMVLVFNRKNENPILQIKTTELYENAVIQGIKIKVPKISLSKTSEVINNNKGSKKSESTNIRLYTWQLKFIKDLAEELNISVSDAVRECIQFSFVVAPLLKEITIWDTLMNMNPDFIDDLTKLKFGGGENLSTPEIVKEFEPMDNHHVAAEQNKKI